MDLRHKTALVTGGASGIGRATALALARAGAQVVCADIDQTKGDALAEEARVAAVSIESVPIDLSDRASVRSRAAKVLERHPRIDILINAAGFGAARSARRRAETAPEGRRPPGTAGPR